MMTQRSLTITSSQSGQSLAATAWRRQMVTRMMTNSASGSDRIVVWSMIAGLALALIQYAQAAALPTHFV
ncbi:hypothetical protein MOF7_12110 [Methylobacterium oryzae]|uniref:Uncharacterized protein n=1 Tax=Methylobacterium oryzae TaxID=334852 RepID=A0ABU7TQ38_9HYPH